MSSIVSESASDPASAIVATGGSFDFGGSRLFSSQSFLFARCRSQKCPLTLRVLGRLSPDPVDVDALPSDSRDWTEFADFWLKRWFETYLKKIWNK